jgi:SPOR domain/GAF domain
MAIEPHRIMEHERATPAASQDGPPRNGGQPDELSARLAAAAKMLADAVPVEPVLVAIGRALLFLAKAEHAAIFLRSTKGFVTCPWSHNLSEVYLKDIVTPEKANPWIHIMRHPELSCMDLPKTKREASAANCTPWFLPDARALSSDHARLVDRITREGLRSICAWPLAEKGRVTGAFVYYYAAPHVCSQDEQEVMTAFGLQAAAALQDPGALSQPQSIRNAENTTTPMDSGAEVGLTPGDSAPKEQITDATTPPLPDSRGATEHEHARAEAIRAQSSTPQRRLETEQARATAERTSLEEHFDRFAQDRAALAAETKRLAEARSALTLEAGQLAEARGSLEVERARLAETEARLAAGPSRWRPVSLIVSTLIAAAVTVVLVIGLESHRPAVLTPAASMPAVPTPAAPTMERKTAAQVSATVVQKSPVPSPVPTPHRAIAAGVVPPVTKPVAPPATPRVVGPRKTAYVVVVGTFESANAAAELKRLVQSKGYVVQVVQQGEVCKVMTPPIRTRTQAQGVAHALKAVGFQPQLTVWPGP